MGQKKRAGVTTLVMYHDSEKAEVLSGTAGSANINFSWPLLDVEFSGGSTRTGFDKSKIVAYAGAAPIQENIDNNDGPTKCSIGFVSRLLPEVPLEPLTTEQEDVVLNEIGYTRRNLSRDLASIRSWLSDQHHLPPSAKSEPDAFFCNFLVGCKGDMNKARDKIDNYYRFRSRAKELCSERDPLEPNVAAMWPYFQLLTLPNPTPDGSRVLMTLSGVPDFPGYSPALIVKRILVIMEMRMRTEVVQGGEYIVMDNHNYSASYFLAVRPTFMRNVIYFIQNVMPWRIRGIISLNTPSFLQVAINRIIKPLFKTKIARRWHVYTEGPEVLTKHFPLSMLPKDYGGGADTLQELSDRWMEYASSTHWREWFMKEGSETVQEANDPMTSYFKG